MRALPQADVDAHWMRDAEAEAQQGQRTGEWPFGAVVVHPDPARHPCGVEVSRAFSSERCTGNPAGHAELHAIEKAGIKGGRLLRGCTLYTTHEPCLMCTGLILQAKLSRVVVGTLRCERPDLFNPDREAFEFLLARNASPAHPVRVTVCGTVDAATYAAVHRECSRLFHGLAPEHQTAA